MATFCLFIFLLIAFFAMLFGYIKTCMLFIGILLVSFVLISSGLLPGWLLQPLQAPFLATVKPQWKEHNAIVLLGAGISKLPGNMHFTPSLQSYSRINAAARYYFSCKQEKRACTVIISGGDPTKIGASEAEVYQQKLLELGMPQTDIQLEPNSLNTFQNAEFTSPLLKQGHYEQIYLVTSSVHLKRSMLFFSHFGIIAQPAPADRLVPLFSFRPKSYNLLLTDLALHEIYSLCYYRIIHSAILNYLDKPQ